MQKLLQSKLLLIGTVCVVLVISLFGASIANAEDASHSCANSKCQVGEVATTYFRKDDSFRACPTRELARYTMFVMGIASMSVQLTGKLPNISDKTGEPEYLDDSHGSNQTRLMLDSMRSQAKVATFDQAIALCPQGVGKRAVTIMNIQTDDRVAYVLDNKNQQKYWMPLSHIDRHK